MTYQRRPIGSINPKLPVYIYGAGVSGLLMAYYLKKQNLKVTLFEKEHVGGKIGTLQTTYGPAEQAANALFTNDDVYELLEELNLPYIESTKKLKKKIWLNNKARTIPVSIAQILKLLIKLGRPIPNKNIEELTISDFFTDLVDQNFADKVVGTALGGIYAEPSKTLHFKSLFPLHDYQGLTFKSFFKALKQSRKSKSKATSIGLQNGMQDFIQALREKLEENIQMTEVTILESNVNHIICTSAYDAAILLKTHAPAVAHELEKIRYNELNTSTIFSTKALPALDKSFGVLFPQTQEKQVIGLLHNSAIFSNRVKGEAKFSYTAITKNTEDAEEEILKTLTMIAPNFSKKDILEIHTSHWKRAIPIYNYSRYQAIEKIRSIGLPNNIVLFGNYVDGISIREMLSSAKKFAEQFKA